MKNQRSKIKNYLKLLVILTFNFVLLIFNLSKANAQTIDPSVWQQNATGLRTDSNADQKTGGLTTIINASGIPFVLIPSGVKDGGWSRVSSPVSLELGEIKIPGTTPSLISESADWSHNEMTFSNSLKIWVSRLTPATLIQNQNNSLRLFSGNVSLYTFNPSSAPALPKYMAYSSGGTVRVQQIPASTATALPLPSLDSNWILIWYGSNGPFIDTKTPITTTYVPQTDSYKADIPLLLKFENNPSSIIQSPEGGIDLAFSGNSGYTSILPLFGREHPQALDTEGWGSSGTLPANVLTKINFWNTNSRLCSYPTTVSETYAYDANTDTATISENITFLSVCAGGSASAGFSIMPPTMALTMTTPNQQGNTNPLNIQINGGPPAGGLTNANYPTEFGPIIGIDNTNTYSYSVSGLKKYTDSQRVVTNTGSAPAELVQELQSEVDKIINAGHFKPWIFSDETPRHNIRGDIYFLNPADTVYHLTEIAHALPDSQTKTNLIDYIKSERSNYPPETIYNLPDTGTLRVSQSLNNYSNWITGGPPDVFLKRVPVYSFYALAKYYDLTAESLPSSVMAAAVTALDNDLAETDWATASWFQGFGTKHAAVESTNRYLTGLIGFTKLAKLSDDSDAESLGMALLAKTALARLAMAQYPRYLYSTGLLVLPTASDWMARYSAGNWGGHIWNYDWSTPVDDLSQVVIMNQFGVYLYDSSGYMTPGSASSEWISHVSAHMPVYIAMAPEAFRLLTDFAKQDFEIFENKYTTFLPHWYMPNTEAVFAGEHNVNHPIDVFQIFMAKVFIQKESPQNLARYVSVPWLYDGSDFFYVQKLAETIKAYQGWEWEDQTYLTADINQDHIVDLNDLNLLFGNWNSPRDRRADVSSDGVVNGIDFGLLVKDWGKIK